MTKEQEATKQRLRELTDELTAAVFGTYPKSRPIPCICRDLHLLGTSPEGRAAGYQRPYDYLLEWEVFSVSRVSKAEQERRKLVDLGWATGGQEDERRWQDRNNAAKRAAAELKERDERLAREQEAFDAANKPLTRASLQRAAEEVASRIFVG